MQLQHQSRNHRTSYLFDFPIFTSPSGAVQKPLHPIAQDADSTTSSSNVRTGHSQSLENIPDLINRLLQYVLLAISQCSCAFSFSAKKSVKVHIGFLVSRSRRKDQWSVEGKLNDDLISNTRSGANAFLFLHVCTAALS